MLNPAQRQSGRLETELLGRGIRLTRQRRVLLHVIENAQKHLDAATILRRAQKQDPGINRVTVYRTLSLLKRHGLVDELDLLHMDGDQHYYEQRPSRNHIHMACLRCGKIREFESTLFERLKGQIERECQFRIAVVRVELGGYCAHCRT